MTKTTLIAAAAFLAGCTGAAQNGDTATKAAGAPVQAAGEASVKAPSTNPATQSTALGAADMISLDRGPCYGTCPVYTIAVTDNGIVSFEGKAHVLKTGKASNRVPPDLAKSLFVHADTIGVAQMADSYREGTSTCGGYVTDLPTATLTIRKAGTTKAVIADYGCEKLPRSLRPLHARLDSIARALGWIPKE